MNSRRDNAQHAELTAYLGQDLKAIAKAKTEGKITDHEARNQGLEVVGEYAYAEVALQAAAGTLIIHPWDRVPLIF